MRIKTLFLIAAGGLCLAATSTNAQFYGGFSQQPMMQPAMGMFQPRSMPGGFGGMSGGGYSPNSYGMARPYASMRGGWGRTAGAGGMMPTGMTGPQMIQRNFTRRNMTRIPGLYGRPNYSRGVRGVLSQYLR